MRMTEFLFNYLLEEVCQGNKSLCARELNLTDRNNIYKALERFEGGGGIGGTVEDMLQCLIRHNVNFDWLVHRYQSAEEWQAPCPRIAALDAAREQWRHGRKRMLYCSRDVFKTLDGIAEQIIYFFCAQGRCPGAESVCEDKCVCYQLAELLQLMCEAFNFENIVHKANYGRK